MMSRELDAKVAQVLGLAVIGVEYTGSHKKLDSGPARHTGGGEVIEIIAQLWELSYFEVIWIYLVIQWIVLVRWWPIWLAVIVARVLIWWGWER